MYTVSRVYVHNHFKPRRLHIHTSYVIPILRAKSTILQCIQSISTHTVILFSFAAVMLIVESLVVWTADQMVAFVLFRVRFADFLKKHGQVGGEVEILQRQQVAPFPCWILADGDDSLIECRPHNEVTFTCATDVHRALYLMVVVATNVILKVEFIPTAAASFLEKEALARQRRQTLRFQNERTANVHDLGGRHGAIW